MGHVDRRSRCFRRHTNAESAGDAADDTADDTTGVARTTGDACMGDAAAWTRPEKAYWELGLRCECIGTVHDLRTWSTIMTIMVALCV